MDSSVSNELNNLFNQDLVSGTERTKILAICNTLVNNGVFLNEVKNNVTNVIEKESFNIEKNIGAVVSCILQIFSKVEMYKEVSAERMKYIVYCLLISVLLKFYPTILQKVEINTLRNLYNDVYDIVMIIPETIKISKKSCLTCIGSSFKLFSFLNKDKILIKK